MEVIKKCAHKFKRKIMHSEIKPPQTWGWNVMKPFDCWNSSFCFALIGKLLVFIEFLLALSFSSSFNRASFSPLIGVLLLLIFSLTTACWCQILLYNNYSRRIFQNPTKYGHFTWYPRAKKKVPQNLNKLIFTNPAAQSKVGD